MGLWHKQYKRVKMQEELASSVEVTKITHKGHVSADKANREITKVNNLLKANGITLKIHIATGGQNHG